MPGFSLARWLSLCCQKTRKSIGFGLPFLRRSRRPWKLRPTLETLEDRTLLATVTWSTYLETDGRAPRPGLSAHSAQAVALDAHGNSVVAGSTSIQSRFPAFVDKIDPTGTRLWHKEIGGATTNVNAVDHGYGVAVDAEGNVLVVGQTFGDLGTGGQCFLAKLSPGGDTLWLMSIAASGPGYAIGVDGAGNAFVAGDVSQAGLAKATNAYPGFRCGFVAMVDAAGLLQWSTYLPSTLGASGIAVDPSGNGFVAGDLRQNNDVYGFVAKFTKAGAVEWTTALGGRSGVAVARDNTGNAVVVGNTVAPNLVGNILNDAQANIDRSGDAFVSKVSKDGAILWARYLGGSSDDVGTGIALDAQGNAWVTGRTGSADFDSAIPVRTGTADDAFVAQVNPDGSLQAANLFGVKDDTAVGGIAVAPALATFVDSAGNWISGLGPSGLVMMAGATLSPELPGATNEFGTGTTYRVFVSQVGIPYYNQGDYSQKYDHSDINPQTNLPFSISKLGCVLVALTMMADYELQSDLDPLELNDLLVQLDEGFDYGEYKDTGLRADDVNNVNATKALVNWLNTEGLGSRQKFYWQDLSEWNPSASVLADLIKQGHPVMVRVHMKGSAGTALNHTVVVTGISGQRFTVYDPGARAVKYLDEYELPGISPYYRVRGYIKDPDDQSLLQIRVTSLDEHLELVVTDALGNTTGTQSGGQLSQIPHSFHGHDVLEDAAGETVHYAHYVDAYVPRQGRYTLQLATTGSTPAAYSLIVHGLTPAGVPGSPATRSGTLSPGQPLTVAVDLEPALGQTALTTVAAPPIVASVSPDSGPLGGGTSVVVGGMNFTGASAVSFGATPATGFTVDSATQITATAPAGTAGTVDIRVTTPAGGVSATSASARFTYAEPVPNVPPTIVALETSVASLTRGTPLELRALGVADADANLVRVEFFRDSNNSGALEVGTDQKLGEDANPQDGWSLAITTTALPLNTVRFLARALDSRNAASSVVSASASLRNAPPTIDALSASALAVYQPGNVTLSPTGVVDVDGTVTRVEYFDDRNDNGLVEIGIDRLLGTSAEPEWRFTGSTLELAPSPHTLLARAIDNEGTPGKAVVISLNVLTAPRLALDWRTDPVFEPTGDRFTTGHDVLLASDHIADVMDKNGVLHVAFVQQTNDYRSGFSESALVYATRTGATWNYQIVDLLPDPVGGIDLVLDSAGKPRLAYLQSRGFFGGATYSLKYSSYSGGTWSTQTINTLPLNAFALALDRNDNPHVAYSYDDSYSVEYIAFDGAAWSKPVVAGLRGDDEVLHVDLALDSTGKPAVLYSLYSEPSRVAYSQWDGANWITQTVDHYARFGPDALILDALDRPHVAYETDGHIKYASRNGSAWESQVVADAYIGALPALGLDAEGNPHIAFYDLASTWYFGWNGYAWAGSVVGPTFSSGGLVAYPHLQIDGTGNPHVFRVRGAATLSLFHATAELPLAAPVAFGPGGTASRVTPTFTWSAVPHAHSYALWLTDLATGQSVNPIVSATAWTPADTLLSGHAYRWWIQARAATGSSGPWSEPFEFTVPLPTPLGPAGSVSNVAVPFTWSLLAGVSQYEVFLSNLTTGGSIDRIVSGTSWTPATTLQSGHTYRWWLRAVGGTGAAQWSNPLDFTVAMPAPSAPAGPVTTVVPAFGWNGVAGVTHYEVFVLDLTVGDWLDQVATGISWVPDKDLPSGHRYRWWVRALSSDGSGGTWSDPLDFATPVPSLTGPTGTVNNVAPQLGWNGVEGAVRYEVFVSNLDTGSWTDTIVSGTAWTPNPTLLSGHRHRWWVRTVPGAGRDSAWSQSADFTVALPSLVGPAATIANAAPTFTWNGVAGVTHYEIFVSSLGAGVWADETVAGTSWTPARPLFAGQGYRWWVRALASDGNGGAWSASRDFAVALPVLIGPSGVTNEVTPLFMWSGVSGLTNYEVFVSDLTSGDALDLGVQGASGRPPQPLHHGHKYRWWVRPLTADGTPGGNWTDFLDFDVALT